MSEVWLTNPTLTAEHDMKVLRAAIGTWAASGWEVREDQSDPAPEIEDVPELQPEPDIEPVVEPEPDPTPAPTGDTTKKGN